VADHEDVLAVHDTSHGGLAVTLAEMVTTSAGATVDLPNGSGGADEWGYLLHEQPGRVVVETSDVLTVREAFDGVAPVHEVGHTTEPGQLDLSVGDETLSYGADEIADLRSVIERELE